MTCKIEAVSLSFQLRLSEHLQIEDTGEEWLDTSMKCISSCEVKTAKWSDCMFRCRSNRKLPWNHAENRTMTIRWLFARSLKAVLGNVIGCVLQTAKKSKNQKYQEASLTDFSSKFQLKSTLTFHILPPSQQPPPPWVEASARQNEEKPSPVVYVIYAVSVSVYSIYKNFREKTRKIKSTCKSTDLVFYSLRCFMFCSAHCIWNAVLVIYGVQTSPLNTSGKKMAHKSMVLKRKVSPQFCWHQR